MSESEQQTVPVSAEENGPPHQPPRLPKPTGQDYFTVGSLSIAGWLLGFALKSYLDAQNDSYLNRVLPFAVSWLGMAIGMVVLIRKKSATGPAVLCGLAWCSIPIFGFGGGFLSCFIWYPGPNTWLSFIPITIGSFAGVFLGFFVVAQALKRLPSTETEQGPPAIDEPVQPTDEETTPST